MKIGCNLYGIKWELAENGIEETLRKLPENGIASIEPFYCIKEKELQEADLTPEWKAMVWTADTMRRWMPVLKENGISVSSVHAYDGEISASAAQAYIGMKQEFGIDHVVFSMKFSDQAGCEEAAEKLNTLNQMVRDAGITIVYHNHDTECAEAVIDGKKQLLLDYFLTLADPEVKLELDVGWILRTGCDPAACLERMGDRVAIVHLKDLAADHLQKTQDEMCVAVGSGILPTEKIVRLSKPLPLAEVGMIVDQDEAGAGSDILTDLKNGSDAVNRFWNAV